jgi:hypothetical protein
MYKSIYGQNIICDEKQNKEFENLMNITLDILKQLNSKKSKKTALERLSGLKDLINVIISNPKTS